MSSKQRKSSSSKKAQSTGDGNGGSKLYRVASLRMKLTDVVLKRVGVTSESQLTEAQQAQLVKEVDILIHFPIVTPSALTAAVKSVKLCREMPAALKTAPASTVATWSAPPEGVRLPAIRSHSDASPLAAAAAASADNNTSISNNHNNNSVTAERRVAGSRYAKKLEDDAQWTKMIAQQTREEQEQAAKERQQASVQKHHHLEVLKQQFDEAHQRKEAEKVALRLHEAAAIEEAERACKQEVEDRIAQRKKLIAERIVRDATLTDMIAKKELEKKNATQAEHEYLLEIQKEAQEKKEKELRDKLAKREAMNKFQEENRRQEAARREKERLEQAAARDEIERMRAHQAKVEEEARAVALRQTDKGKSLSKRQEVIAALFEERKAKEDVLKTMEELRIEKEATLKQQHDQEDNIRRKSEASKRNEETKKVLAVQLEEHERRRKAEEQEALRQRQEAELALKVASMSDREGKSHEKDRQRAFLPVPPPARRT